LDLAMPAITTIPMPLDWAITVLREHGTPFIESHLEASPVSASMVVDDNGNAYVYLHDEFGREIDVLQGSTRPLRECEVLLVSITDGEPVSEQVFFQGTQAECIKWMRSHAIAQPNTGWGYRTVDTHTWL
jgi:hypothetical protein